LSVPYSPTPFSTPVPVNPTYGGVLGDIIPYISPTAYRSEPTSMSTNDLIPSSQTTQSNAAAQEQALVDTLRRASEWTDRICFGAVASSKRTGLRASINVEVDVVPVINGYLKLYCDIKPIAEVRGVDVGVVMGSLTSIGASLASGIRIGRRTIYVPFSIPYFSASFRNYAMVEPPDKLTVVWAYVGGFPHTSLAANIVSGTSSATLTPTDGSTGLLAVYPGTSMEIVDGVNTEYFVVQSLNNNVVISTTPFVNNHAVPAGPDFIAVTSVPPGVRLATTFLCTALLKTRGDSSIALEEITSPKVIQKVAGDVFVDIMMAKDMLKPYMSRVKKPR
jgi:hypothetical protein